MSTEALAHPEQPSDNIQPPSGRVFGPSTPTSILRHLFVRGEGTFDVEELKFLSRATEAASFMSHQLACTVSAIGCLAQEESDRKNARKTRSGSLEDPFTLGQLMFTIAEQVSIISQLCDIGSETEWKLRDLGVSDA